MLDYASRNRTNLLYDIYVMGKRSIENGSKDSWTITPKRIEALERRSRRRLRLVRRLAARVDAADAVAQQQPQLRLLPLAVRL